MKREKYGERIKELAALANDVKETVYHSEYHYEHLDESMYNKWIVNCENILKLTFGEASSHYKQFKSFDDKTQSYTNIIPSIEGVLLGAYEDYVHGYVEGQEFLIAGEIFDSVLNESKHLLDTSHKDASAILARVVIEDSLKRLARQNDINDNQRASKLNELLKQSGVYSQPQWRQIQSFLDIGNSAAHGNFNEYDENEVRNMLNGIEQFFVKFF